MIDPNVSGLIKMIIDTEVIGFYWFLCDEEHFTVISIANEYIDLFDTYHSYT